MNKDNLAKAKELLTDALWMANPQRYTEIRLELLGDKSTVLPPGTGAFGSSSSVLRDENEPVKSFSK